MHDPFYPTFHGAPAMAKKKPSPFAKPSGFTPMPKGDMTAKSKPMKGKGTGKAGKKGAC